MYKIFYTSSCRCIWVRSSWSNQLQDGRHHFRIGDAHGTEGKHAAVTLRSSYYFDEGAVFDDLEMAEDDSVAVDLLVCTKVDETISEIVDSDREIGDVKGNDHHAARSAWVLDICMDYFSTCNPFMMEVNDILRSKGMGREELGVIQETYRSFAYKKEDIEAKDTIGPDDVCTTKSSIKYLTNFRGRLSLTSLERRVHKQEVDRHLADVVAKYETSETKILNVESLHSTTSDKMFHPWLSPESDGDLLLKFLRTVAQLPKKERMRVLEIGHLVNLPHHVSTDCELEDLIKNFEINVRSVIHRMGVPGAITIARSAKDEYTPKHQVDHIQERVLQVLARVLGSGMDMLLHDLRTEAALKAHYLFVHKVNLTSQSLRGQSLFPLLFLILTAYVLHRAFSAK